MWPKSLPALAVFASFLWGMSPAVAHVHLVSSTPADKSSTESSTEIMMKFNGPLITRVSAFKLTDSRGGQVAAALLPSSNTEIIAKPQQPLAPGVYRATWTAAGENDGHRMSGNISFTVK